MHNAAKAAKFIPTKSVLYVAEWPSLTLIHKWDASFPFKCFSSFSFRPHFSLVQSSWPGKSVLCAQSIVWLSLFYKNWTYFQFSSRDKACKGQFSLPGHVKSVGIYKQTAAGWFLELIASSALKQFVQWMLKKTVELVCEIQVVLIYRLWKFSCAILKNATGYNLKSNVYLIRCIRRKVSPL